MVNITKNLQFFCNRLDQKFCKTPCTIWYSTFIWYPRVYTKTVWRYLLVQLLRGDTYCHIGNMLSSGLNHKPLIVDRHPRNCSDSFLIPFQTLSGETFQLIDTIFRNLSHSLFSGIYSLYPKKKNCYSVFFTVVSLHTYNTVEKQ